MTASENFVYTPASTDVSIRWRQLYGYVPPSEDSVYHRKWAEFRALAAKGIESIEKPQPVFTEKVLKLRNKNGAS